MKAWLIGISAVAVLAALTDCLTQNPVVRRVTRIVCGLLILFATLKPIREGNLSALSDLSWNADFRQIEDDAVEIARKFYSDEIADYIKTLAETFDVQIEKIRTSIVQSDGRFYANSVEINYIENGDISGLAEEIEQKLGIDREDQFYFGGNE